MIERRRNAMPLRNRHREDDSSLVDVENVLKSAADADKPRLKMILQRRRMSKLNAGTIKGREEAAKLKELEDKYFPRN